MWISFFVFFGYSIQVFYLLRFILQAELNKAAADNDSIENGPQNDGKNENDKTGSKNAKHHSLLLQVIGLKINCTL